MHFVQVSISNTTSKCLISDFCFWNTIISLEINCRDNNCKMPWTKLMQLLSFIWTTIKTQGLLHFHYAIGVIKFKWSNRKYTTWSILLALFTWFNLNKVNIKRCVLLDIRYTSTSNIYMLTNSYIQADDLHMAWDYQYKLDNSSRHNCKIWLLGLLSHFDCYCSRYCWCCALK